MVRKYASPASLFVKIAVSLGLFLVFARAVESVVDAQLLLASYGAMTALLFGLELERVTRLRNVVLGHLISASAGVAVGCAIGPHSIDIAVVVAVATAVALMMVCDALHPPGGAVAMIFASTPSLWTEMPLVPVLGTVLLGTAYWTIVRFVGTMSDRLSKIASRKFTR